MWHNPDAGYLSKPCIELATKCLPTSVTEHMKMCSPFRALFGTYVSVFFLFTAWPAFVEGQLSWQQSSDAMWAAGCDFKGDDIGNAKIPADLCSMVCGQRQGCTHFAWTTFNEGACWMKSRRGISTSSAVSSSEPGALCGIMLPPPVQPPRWVLFVRAGNQEIRTKRFSEEDGGYSGRQTTPIAGMECFGRYCDDKELVIIRDGTQEPLLESNYWTPLFTGNGSAICPTGMLVNELKCEGRYYVSIRLQCGALRSDYRVTPSKTSYVNWFSDEQGEMLCPDGSYMNGMRCRDRLCDDNFLDCVRVEKLES